MLKDIDEPEDAEYEMFDAVPTSSRKNASDEAADKYDIANLYDLIGTLGSNNDITITVDKQGRNGKYEFVETYPSSDVTTDTINMIRDELGAGSYRFRAKRKGDKHPLWSNNYSFTKRLRSEEIHKPYNSTPAIDLSPVLEQLRAQNEMMLKLFEQSNNRPRPEDQEEQQLRKMMLYKQLFDGGGNKGTGDLDMFLKLIPLVKDLVVPDSGSNSTDLIRDVIKGMTEIVKQPRPPLMPGQPRPHPALAQPQPLNQNPASAQDLKKKEIEKTMLNYFTYLTDRAIAGDDPKTLAATIVEKIDADNLVELLEQENLIDLIIASDIRAHAHQGWFETLIKEIEELIFEDDDEESNSVINEVEVKPDDK